MVYIYVCKRFKVTMEMISSKEGDWVNNLLQSHCKHTRLHAKLERAEINPKKRMSTNTYDSSADVFKLDLVYKDRNGAEHELKWLIKVTRSDVNEMADRLLRHEKQFFSRLLSDLIDAVKQRSVGRLEGSRVSFNDILQTPEFIFEETQAQADVLRNVLVIDNLEEKTYIPLKSGGALNLWHLRVVVKTIARFHAIGLLYKKVMFDVFKSHSAQVAAAKHIDDVEIEGENLVPTERFGLFSRFPFLTQRQQTLTHLIGHRHQFLDMYQRILECFPDEPHLIESFEYLRISIDDILRLDEDMNSQDVPEHTLDSIAIGIVEARSFLFSYGDAGSGAEADKKKKGGAGVQRSQSEKSKDKETFLANKAQQLPQKKPVGPTAKSEAVEIPGAAKAKCLKLEKQNSVPTNGGGMGGGNKAKNMFLQNAKGMSKDDVHVPLSTEKKGAKERDPNTIPKTAALVNGKYVTYTRVTRDLAVTFFTCGDWLIRRFYLIKMVECYAETLGITLGQLGVDTESYGVSYVNIVRDFQQHILYGFFIGVLIAMANTSPEELDRYVSKCNEAEGSGTTASESQKQQEASGKYVALTSERVEFLVDMMRDVNVYVESKDFELGLPITNFARYHELWSMQYGAEEE